MFEEDGRVLTLLWNSRKSQAGHLDKALREVYEFIGTLQRMKHFGWLLNDKVHQERISFLGTGVSLGTPVDH